jgi:hypothetical protein
MDVFLIPTGANRYELYCEIPDGDQDDGEPPPTGFLRGLVHQFREALAEAERERHRPPHERESGERPSLYQRIKRQAMCRIAESIAEQRLLWHLRRQDAVSAIHPDDVTTDTACEVVRAAMRADFEKHRRWLVIDGLLLIASGLLILVPGPNIVGYYLAFRVVGHFLSMRGARQALHVVRWHYRPSALLAELRQAIALEPGEREARVTDIAARLRLERLAAFFARTVVPSA